MFCRSLRFLSRIVVLAAAVPLVAQSLHRIGVRVVDNRGQFYDTVTGVEFSPRGNNYVRFAYQYHLPQMSLALDHSTLDPDRYNPVQVDAALAAMEGQGYNFTKVWLNYCCKGNQLGADTGTGLNPAYVANMADFVKRAAAHHVYVSFTIDVLPWQGGYIEISNQQCCQYFNSFNIQLLSPGGAQAQTKLWQDIVTGLIANQTPLDAIFAYELVEEYHYDDSYPPFSLNSGLVTAANGKQYDLSSSADKLRMKQEGLAYLGTVVRNAIRQLDPQAMLAVGFAQIVRDGHSLMPFPTLATSDFDFVDYHPTPGQGFTLAQYLDGIDMQDQGTKPVLHGEIGAEIAKFPSEDDGALVLQQWQAQGCRAGIQGWSLWTWDTGVADTLEYRDFWSATRGNGNIGTTLSPAFRPDPCTSFSISAARVDFGRIMQGLESRRTVTVVNDGDAPMSIAALTVAGEFSQTNSCPSSILPNDRCTIEVRFAPVAPGVQQGTLTIADDAAGSPHVIPLVGTGVSDAIELARPSRPGRAASASASQLSEARTATSSASIQTLKAAAVPALIVTAAPRPKRQAKSKKKLRHTRGLTPETMNQPD